MARLPPLASQRSAALGLILVFGVAWLLAGIAAALLGVLRPEALPAVARPPQVPLEAVGGAAVALGSGGAVIGLAHLAFVALTSGSRWWRGALAAGTTGAAAMSVALFGGMLASVVSAAGLALTALLLLASLLYGWAAVVLAPLDRSDGDQARV